ncbi:MAG: hypothetical protein U0103_27295 [Candidatus Obscuribacterales bacterium]
MTDKYPLNLPQTDFPMKANSATREVETQKFWDENRFMKRALKEKSVRQICAARRTSLPEFSQDPHRHGAKQDSQRHRHQVQGAEGFYAPYVPGYDSPGLPIETAVLKEVKGGRAALTPVELRRRCRDFALGN